MERTELFVLLFFDHIPQVEYNMAEEENFITITGGKYI